MFIVCLYLPFPGVFFHFGSQLFIFYIFSAVTSSNLHVFPLLQGKILGKLGVNRLYDK
jgi:hypothetical protein